MTPHTFIFIGRSGSGKGTQVQLLRDYITDKDPDTAQFCLSTGDRFRSFLKTNSHSQMLSKKIMDAGGLQPSFLAVFMWAGAFIEEVQGGEHIFTDGFPRTRSEAEILHSAWWFYNRDNPYVIEIAVSKDESRKRLLARGRADDNEEAIEERVNYYDKDVVPALDFYRNNDFYNFIAINGEQSAEKVHQDIVSALAIENKI
jgi:adenylate kinase